MCIQGTCADTLIIQAVADALNVTIQIVESNQGFLLKMFLSLTTKTLSLFLKSTRHFLGFFWILSFLYARSGQVRNRIFHMNEQLFLKKVC